METHFDIQTETYSDPTEPVFTADKPGSNPLPTESEELKAAALWCQQHHDT